MTGPQDLLDLAKSLRQGGGEVELRAAASRAYYAMFHFAKSFHAALPEPGMAASHGAGGDHLDLAHRLKSPAAKISATQPELATKSRRIGILLDSIRPMRHHADYDLGQTFGMDVADTAIATAEKVLAL